MLLKRKLILQLLPVYVLVLAGVIALTAVCERTIETMSPMIREERHTVIIDPGHGGVDGGATSCTGVLESNLNLEIALRLNDMMRLLGIQTLMIRDSDMSVYTEGETIAQKKVSDLKQRVRVINQTNKGILISIHQNTFSEEKYWGTQVFYANTDGSRELAEQIQGRIKTILSPGNHRKIKKSEGVYLIEKVLCPAVLVECGFLSNPEEEALLRDPTYQKKLCSVIAIACSQYLSDGNI